MSKQQVQELQLGGVPRADLLPASAREAIRRRPIVRRLVIGVIGMAAVIVLAIVAATVYDITAQVQLQAERDRSETLLAQQLEFAEAKAISDGVAEGEAARLGVMATEVDWLDLSNEIRATLPTGIILDSVDGKVLESIADEEGGEGSAEESDDPLRQQSVGSIVITATSETVPDVQAWLDALASLTGFAGIAPPTTVTGAPDTGYTVSIEVLINEGAYIERFVDESAGEGDASSEGDN